jgi:hypothetical protein
MFVLFAVHLWSQAMVQWNEVPWWPASTATSVWLGVATSFLIILVVSVIATLVVTVNRAVRAIATTSRGEIVGPLAAIGASLVLIAIPVHQSLANVIARNGIQWGNPGRAIKQLAGACVVATDQVARFWEHPSAYLRLHTLDVGLEPLFALALAWGVSAIIRRTDFPLWDHRLSRSLTAVLSVSMGVFLLSYLGWIVSGGPNKGVLFGLPESVGARSLQISVMVIMAIAALRAVLLWRSHAPRELTTRTA